MTRIKHSAGFEISQPADILFPLFSAEGEKLWVPGWDYKNIMGTTSLHEDYIFLTQNHDHGSSEAVWLVKCYDPGAFYVQFYKVESGDKVGIISVQCSKTGKHRTHVQVTYEYVGLSRKGDQFIAGFTKSRYESFIGEWKSLLTSYFDSAH